MLPRALQRAERPAEALLRERAHGVRRLGVTDRTVGIRDGVSLAPNGERQVLILGERVVAEAADLLDEIASPCAHGAGHDRDAIEEREGAAVEVLARDVLD